MDIGNIQESDVSELPDEELNRVVAEWLDEVEGCFECDGYGEIKVGIGDGGRWADPWKECHKCGGSGNSIPDYCNDPEAAWRLLLSIPPKWWMNSKGAVMELVCSREGYEVLASNYENPKRALAEAAAELADRGIEPREVS